MTTSSLKQLYVDRTAIIGVVGMGYVGMPLALTASAAGFRIIGFDIDPRKVDDINAGRNYIKHIEGADVAAAVYAALGANAKLAIDTRNACARAGVVSDNVVKA
jgi:UDP-N-acetyl-D-mannosaminuronate dehydrogenase